MQKHKPLYTHVMTVFAAAMFGGVGLSPSSLRTLAQGPALPVMAGWTQSLRREDSLGSGSGLGSPFLIPVTACECPFPKRSWTPHLERGWHTSQGLTRGSQRAAHRYTIPQEQVTT